MEIKNKKQAAVKSIKVDRANDYNGKLYFDVIINGVTIYGCRLIDGEKGMFVMFPSHKSEKNGKYYKYAYVDLTDAEVQEIVDQISKI